MIKNIILLLLVCVPSLLFSQVQGIVFGITNGQKVPLQRASVKLRNTQLEVYTSEDGRLSYLNVIQNPFPV